jgi:hypothetical protein
MMMETGGNSASFDLQNWLAMRKTGAGQRLAPGASNGGRQEDRTPDLSVANAALSQLS